MLFNSFAFIFAFFPIVFAGFYLLARIGYQHAAVWLGLASVFFYGYWNYRSLPLLLGSIIVNYWLGARLARHRTGAGSVPQHSRWLLAFAVGMNLGLLCFFKYANFFIANANPLLMHLNVGALPVLDVLLPIGISFYTFTQIAFLVDCWRGDVAETRFSHYLLFVTYFPHLIAGPVLHHSQMMPQFAAPRTYRIDAFKVSIGLSIFVIGLAKKLLIADELGGYAELLFGSHERVVDPALFLAWFGALAYTFQIYYDFSGYSDMAIGLSMCFGVRLPINFNSPYQARSIIDFWRRWHITLSTFLRDYLYIPLGGAKAGAFRRYLNLMITMLLGGLWHGANWTFVLWGALHGALLIVNHGWRWLVGARVTRAERPWAVFSWILSFLAVCATWVLFRAPDIVTAVAVYRGMLGLNGISVPPAMANLASIWPAIRLDGLWQIGLSTAMSTRGFLGTLLVAAGIAWWAPNAMRLLELRELPSLHRQRWLGAAAGAAFAYLAFSLSRPSRFLYFQF